MQSPPRQELEDLLLLLFRDNEVRRLVRLLHGGDAMHAELPGPGVSLEELVHETVSVLERHGQLDQAFSDAMVVKSPGREDELRALLAGTPGAAGPADEWLAGLPAPTHDRLVGRSHAHDRRGTMTTRIEWQIPPSVLHWLAQLSRQVPVDGEASPRLSSLQEKHVRTR